MNKAVKFLLLPALLALSVATIGTAAAQPATNVSTNQPTTKTEPVMTEELMGRLIKYTRARVKTGTIAAGLCKVLGLCDGTKAMPFKIVESDIGDHYFGLPPESDSKDILFFVVRDKVVEAYLTDKTGKLRAAAVSDDGTAYLITNEKAAEKFKAELALFAKEAADPPVTESAVPDKK